MPANNSSAKQNAAHFYRFTIAMARLGDRAALQIVANRGWNIFARVGTVKTPLGVVTNRDPGVAQKNQSAQKPAPPPQKSAPIPPKAPRAKPSVPNSAPKTPRVKRVKVAKIFSQFLATRCKSLTLAAKVLGITPRPPLVKSAVRAAWISLISIHHPDKGGALEAAQAVNAAYQLLQKFSN